MSSNELSACRDLFERNADLLDKVEQMVSVVEPPTSKAGPCGAYAAAEKNWPDPLEPEAFHGLAGEIVHAIEPHSEADPAALLLQFLGGFGNIIGRQPHFLAEQDIHPCNFFIVLVGTTSKGRKGVSWGQIRHILEEVDVEWARTRVLGGLASGEGLIWAVRDPMQGDAGVSDKRLMVFEPEFARVLQVAERDTNTLSAIIRQAWDTGNLRILTKKQAASATDAYISIIGHITKHELKRLLTETATANGFGNRILWACVHRSKVLPEGGDFQSVNLSPLLQRLRNAVDFARGVHQISRDENARAIWAEVYKDLSEGKPGLFGAITGRAEAQTLRLPDTYALLDCSDVVRAEHLMAGLAVWKYCEASARFISAMRWEIKQRMRF